MTAIAVIILPVVDMLIVRTMMLQITNKTITALN